MTRDYKKDFPIFQNQQELVYLDTTATSLKPQVVLDAMNDYYTRYGANVSRGIYKIAEQATAAYEGVREKVVKFINAPSSSEIVFTRNATESINLVAYTLGKQIVRVGHEVVVTVMEHHANFVPWQQLCQRVGADFIVKDVDAEGRLLDIAEAVTEKTKIVAFTAVSNTLGTINPVAEIIARVKMKNPNVIVLVDAAAAAPHMAIDVQKWGADFIVFSSHKMLGSTGVGVLWGKKELLEQMPPFLFGGDMISDVSAKTTAFTEVPHKFEAGTPDISGVIGLGAAIDYLQKIGMGEVAKHELRITNYALTKLREAFGRDITIFGPQRGEERSGVVAFALANAHPHDIAQVLDERNICIRAGHHCTMPLHARLGVPATARASWYIYNDEVDVDMLVAGLLEVVRLFR